MPATPVSPLSVDGKEALSVVDKEPLSVDQGQGFGLSDKNGALSPSNRFKVVQPLEEIQNQHMTFDHFGFRKGDKTRKREKENLECEKYHSPVGDTQKPFSCPVDPVELATLLAGIPSERSSLSLHTRPYVYYPSGPPIIHIEFAASEAEERACQARFYHALLDYGGRALFPLSLLPQVETDPDAYRDTLRLWTYRNTSGWHHDQQDTSKDWKVFSTQLDRWREFRAWQLEERRQIVPFSEYLHDERRYHDMLPLGEYRLQFKDDIDFEEYIRDNWERLLSGLDKAEDDAEAILFRHAATCSRLVMDNGFVQPFQLQADPKQQDQWTTFVEYLAFECLLLGRHTGSVRRLQPQYDAEWEKLVKAGVVGPLDTRDLASTEAKAMRLREVSEASDAANAAQVRPGATLESPEVRLALEHCFDIEQRNSLVDKYVNNTKGYLWAKKEADRQQRRVEWVLSKISKVEAEQKAAGKGTGSGGTGSGKRKRTTDDVGKQRRTDETEKTVASGSDKAGGVHDTDGGVPEPKSKAATTDSRPRRKSQRTSPRDAVLGSRADRLATLRPRVNNKAVVGVGRF